jgi:hypothetical protein
MEIEGKLHLRKAAVGSKSEHQAVFLEMTDGQFVRLHQGDNPFNSPLLKSMVGQQVKIVGTMGNSAFRVQTIQGLE